VFHMGVAKVDLDVAIVVHVCCKLLFLMFYLFFRCVCCKCVYLDVAYVSQNIYKCFIWMQRMFCNGFKCFYVFLQVLQMYFSSVSSTFRQMLQMVQMSVSNVDRVLHLPHCLMLPRLGVSSSSQSPLGIHRLIPLLSMPVTF
jgi:hypothetical protein